jgi:hypothetical protein
VSKKPCPKMSAKKGQGPEPPQEPEELPPDPPDGLTSKQREAIEALAQGQSTAQAAAAAGVNARTVRRWGKEPEFHSALLELRREAVGQAVGLMQRYAPVAAATMLRVMNDASAPASSKVTAAAAVFKYAREGVDMDALVERVQALERSATGQGLVVKPAGNRSADESEEDGE